MKSMSIPGNNPESLLFNRLSVGSVKARLARQQRSNAHKKASFSSIEVCDFSNKRAQGFSLLEVLLVLVIGGLLMGVVATSLSDGPVLRKSARDVAASLRHARSVAILQQKQMVWSMDVKSREFWGESNKNVERRSFHTSITAKINTAASEVVSGSQGNIRFFPDGSSTGGSVELTAREQTYKVNVEWISGRISIL